MNTRTVADVAAILRVWPKTVTRWIEAGELRASKSNRISDRDLSAFIDSRLTTKET